LINRETTCNNIVAKAKVEFQKAKISKMVK
jgi:hypothetical protein